MRILIFGAGVIGSLYAALFSEAGAKVTMLARGRRREVLLKKGLLYVRKKGRKSLNRRVFLPVISVLRDEDIYDYIFVTVRENQIIEALESVKKNKSRTIVTMVNTLSDYKDWEKIVGKGRILPAFPGAGGAIEKDVLIADLTPGFVQKTTFGEICGEESRRVLRLSKLFRKAKIPYATEKDMAAWQLSHVALVVPLADAYYYSKDPENVWKDKRLIKKTACRLKRNFTLLHRKGKSIRPGKYRLLRLLPVPIIASVLSIIYRTEFAHTFMYAHSMKAKDEMNSLHDGFYRYLKEIK